MSVHSSMATNYMDFDRSATRSASLANRSYTIRSASDLFTLAEFLFAATLQHSQNTRCRAFVNANLIHGQHVAAHTLDGKWISPLHCRQPAQNGVDLGHLTRRQYDFAPAPKMISLDPTRPAATPPLGQRAKCRGCR